MPNIRVMHYGLGPIGAAVLKQVAERRGFKIVGAIDVDPSKSAAMPVTRRVCTRRLGVKVRDDPVRALKSARPDVVVLCTSSSIKKVCRKSKPS